MLWQVNFGEEAAGSKIESSGIVINHCRAGNQQQPGRKRVSEVNASGLYGLMVLLMNNQRVGSHG
jgi:hypothetical protein